MTSRDRWWRHHDEFLLGPSLHQCPSSLKVSLQLLFRNHAKKCEYWIILKQPNKKPNKNNSCFAALRYETAKKTLTKTRAVSLRFATKQLIRAIMSTPPIKYGDPGALCEFSLDVLSLVGMLKALRVRMSLSWNVDHICRSTTAKVGPKLQNYLHRTLS